MRILTVAALPVCTPGPSSPLLLDISHQNTNHESLSRFKIAHHHQKAIACHLLFTDLASHQVQNKHSATTMSRPSSSDEGSGLRDLHDIDDHEENAIKITVAKPATESNVMPGILSPAGIKVQNVRSPANDWLYKPVDTNGPLQYQAPTAQTATRKPTTSINQKAKILTV